MRVWQRTNTGVIYYIIYNKTVKIRAYVIKQNDTKTEIFGLQTKIVGYTVYNKVGLSPKDQTKVLKRIS